MEHGQEKSLCAYQEPKTGRSVGSLVLTVTELPL